MNGYDQPGTWTNLYNILWQSIVPMPEGRQPIPASDVARACNFYKAKTLKYGLPLESLKDSTNTPWMHWMSAICPQDQFEELTNALWTSLNSTTSRVPFTDYYDSNTSNSIMFRDRPIVGGLAAKLLVVQGLPSSW